MHPLHFVSHCGVKGISNTHTIGVLRLAAHVIALLFLSSLVSSLFLVSCLLVSFSLYVSLSLSLSIYIYIFIYLFISLFSLCIFVTVSRCLSSLFLSLSLSLSLFLFFLSSKYITNSQTRMNAVRKTQSVWRGVASKLERSTSYTTKLHSAGATSTTISTDFVV